MAACNAMTSEDCDCPRKWGCSLCGLQFDSFSARTSHALVCKDDTDPRDARIADLTRDADEWRDRSRQYERERFEAVASYSKCLVDEQTLHRETQRQLDEARALVEAATRFAIGGNWVVAATLPGGPWSVIHPWRTAPGQNNGLSRDDAIAKARALAKEENK